MSGESRNGNGQTGGSWRAGVVSVIAAASARRTRARTASPPTNAARRCIGGRPPEPDSAGRIRVRFTIARPRIGTRTASLVLMFVNIMTYFEGRFPLSLAHSRAGGADAAPEPILHRVEQDRTRGTHSQGTEVYVTISRCHPREDRPVRGRGLGQ